MNKFIWVKELKIGFGLFKAFLMVVVLVISVFILGVIRRMDLEWTTLIVTCLILLLFILIGMKDFFFRKKMMVSDNSISIVSRNFVELQLDWAEINSILLYSGSHKSHVAVNIRLLNGNEHHFEIVEYWNPLDLPYWAARKNFKKFIDVLEAFPEAKKKLDSENVIDVERRLKISPLI